MNGEMIKLSAVTLIRMRYVSRLIKPTLLALLQIIKPNSLIGANEMQENQDTKEQHPVNRLTNEMLINTYINKSYY
jgi:hypothetical protein